VTTQFKHHFFTFSNPAMTTLITGGGSKIGTHLGLLLKAAGHEAVFASGSGNRIPDGFGSVKLDWKDPATFQGALDTNPAFIYLVAEPGNPNSYKQVIPFIDAAAKRGGIKKFVCLSASAYSDELGGAQLPRYLKENRIDHVILRPTWFIGAPHFHFLKQRIWNADHGDRF
jgi:nucleoside-diphosphate-sugar epimerase